MRDDGQIATRIIDHLSLAKEMARQEGYDLLIYLVEMAMLEASECKEKSKARAASVA